MDLEIINNVVKIQEMSLPLSSAILGFIDGINPCSLWVLTFLLSFVVSTKNRKKVIFVGLSFIVTATITYSIVISGIISIVSYMYYIKWIKYTIAIVALSFAIINIKDYFFFKKGVSLTIPDKYKNKIYKQTRFIRNENNSIIANIIAVIILAAGITLVELPCSMGIPVLWGSLIAGTELSNINYLFLLTLYMLMFMLDELIIYIIAVYTMKQMKLKEEQGRMLKLFSGQIMLVLALSMIFMPTLLNDFTKVLFVFIGIIINTFIIDKIFKSKFIAKNQ